MASRGTYITSLVILVIAAFSTGLVAGVNIGRSASPPEEVCEQNPVGKTPKPAEGSGNDNEKAPAEYPQTPDFELVELETGEPVDLKAFSGSHMLLFISTTT